MDDLRILGRTRELFTRDVTEVESALKEEIERSRFLVIGAAGTIGQAVVVELFKRNPFALHAVDISENNLVELVRNLRSTVGYGSGEFATFAIDCGGPEFEAMFENHGPYDYVFNLSALKHVRSEKDPYTLMRMIVVNVINTIRSVKLAKSCNAKNYFCVSTDKAANPVNMMGASKRIMEMFLMRESLTQDITMARFANVAFSDGSLLHGFSQRYAKRQPITAPQDVKRYFLTRQEAGELCLLAALKGENRDVFFPSDPGELKLETFANIAQRFLERNGYGVKRCESEEEARQLASSGQFGKAWPCYFFDSNTTGEKDFEEFFTNKEELDLDSFTTIGVIKNKAVFEEAKLDEFLFHVESLRGSGAWTKEDLLVLFHKLVPDFAHKETGKYLDQRM